MNKPEPALAQLHPRFALSERQQAWCTKDPDLKAAVDDVVRKEYERREALSPQIYLSLLRRPFGYRSELVLLEGEDEPLLNPFECSRLQTAAMTLSYFFTALLAVSIPVGLWFDEYRLQAIAVMICSLLMIGLIEHLNKTTGLNIEYFAARVFSADIKSWQSEKVEAAQMRWVQAMIDRVLLDNFQKKQANQIQPSYMKIVDDDVRLALAGVRIEMERRLRTLAALEGIKAKTKSLGDLMPALLAKKSFRSDQVFALNKLITILNRPHGHDVDPEVGHWIKQDSISILARIDQLIEEKQNAHQSESPANGSGDSN